MSSFVNFKKIIELGKQKGFTFEDIGNQAGVKRSTWYNYKSGNTAIPFDVVVGVSKILDCQISDISLVPGSENRIIVNEQSETYEVCQECRKKDKTIEVLTNQLEKTQRELEICLGESGKSKRRFA